MRRGPTSRAPAALDPAYCAHRNSGWRVMLPRNSLSERGLQRSRSLGRARPGPHVQSRAARERWRDRNHKDAGSRDAGREPEQRPFSPELQVSQPRISSGVRGSAIEAPRREAKCRAKPGSNPSSALHGPRRLSREPDPQPPSIMGGTASPLMRLHSGLSARRLNGVAGGRERAPH